MPYFKALETYGSNFKALCDLGYDYRNELGTSGVREGALKGPLNRLKAALGAAKQFQQANRSPQSTTAKGVKELVTFHTGQQFQNKQNEQMRLNLEAIQLRQWLSRQGAWFSGDDDLNWPQTMKLRVVYDSELAQQGLTKINIAGNRLYTSDGKPLDTAKMVTHFSGPGYAVYVMSAEGNLHVHSHSVGHYHHSSLLGGAQVAGAGELKVTGGKIVWLSNKSGHYRPGRSHLLQILGMLQKNGIDLDFSLSVLNGNKFGTVGEFMASEKLDDASIATIVPIVTTVVNAFGHSSASNLTGSHYQTSPGDHYEVAPSSHYEVAPSSHYEVAPSSHYEVAPSMGENVIYAIVYSA